MKEQNSGKFSSENKSSTGAKNPKKDKIVNEQEQRQPVNSQQELPEQDSPSGDYVSEREMSREAQGKPDTDRSAINKATDYDKNEKDSGTNAENAQEKFRE